MRGYGEDCASALNGSGGRILFAECDPLCALQTCYEAVQVETVMSEIDIFVSPTGIITLDHMKKLKHNTFVGNTGYTLIRHSTAPLPNFTHVGHYLTCASFLALTCRYLFLLRSTGNHFGDRSLGKARLCFQRADRSSDRCHGPCPYSCSSWNGLDDLSNLAKQNGVQPHDDEKNGLLANVAKSAHICRFEVSLRPQL